MEDNEHVACDWEYSNEKKRDLLLHHFYSRRCVLISLCPTWGCPACRPGKAMLSQISCVYQPFAHWRIFPAKIDVSSVDLG